MAYQVIVIQVGCGELIVKEVREEDSGDPEQIRLVVSAFRPGEGE
jgi:hypothetical protein